jgi:hypothetical protein
MFNVTMGYHRGWFDFQLVHYMHRLIAELPAIEKNPAMPPKTASAPVALMVEIPWNQKR